MFLLSALIMALSVSIVAFVGDMYMKFFRILMVCIIIIIIILFFYPGQIPGSLKII